MRRKNDRQGWLVSLTYADKVTKEKILFADNDKDAEESARLFADEEQHGALKKVKAVRQLNVFEIIELRQKLRKRGKKKAVKA